MEVAMRFVAGERVVSIPARVVEGLESAARARLVASGSGLLLQWTEGYVPVLPLGALLSPERAAPEGGTFVLCRFEDGLLALHVDAWVGVGKLARRPTEPTAHQELLALASALTARCCGPRPSPAARPETAPEA